MSLENTHDIGNVKIVMLGGSGGATALSDLTDTNISNPASGQVLKYNGIKWANGDIVSGLGIGKKTSVSNNVIITDIDLHREPVAGDRLLIYFDTTVQSPTGLTTYNNGTAVTKNLENVSPLYYNAGWNVAEFKNDGLLYNNVWVRVQNVPVINYNAGSGISISNNTIVNTRRGALTGAIDSISSGYAHVVMNGARDTFAAGALIVVQAETSGSATNLRIQYGSQASDSQDFRFYDTEGDTLSLSISSGNTIIAMIDSTGYRAIVLKVLDIEAQVGEPVRELRKLKIDGVVYDTDGMRTYEASNVANNNITLSVFNAFQFVQKVIAINTGAHSGSSNGWNLVISDGMEVASVALKNADGTAFADDIHENELLFVYVDTAGNVARVLEIHSHDLEILKDAIITEKTVSGNPITVTDALPYNAVSLSAEIEAEQDLHGQSAPYVGGAGKNKLPMTVSAIKAANTSGTWNGNSYTHNGVTYTIQTDSDNNITGFNIGSGATASGESYLNVNASLNDIPNGTYILNGCPSNGADDTYKLMVIKSPSPSYADKGNGITVTKDNTVTLYQARIVIANGYAIPSGGLLFKPMLRLATESDATFAPYSNICPISGRTAVAVDDVGKNIWDEQWEIGMISSVNGQNEEGNSTIRSQNYIPVTPSTNYYIRCSQGAVILFYAGDKSYITYQNLNNGGTFTTPQNAKYIRFRTYIAYGTTYNNDICINISDASFNGQYVPYAHSSVIIQLGQIVYVGTLNLTTGVLTIIYAFIIYDGSSDEEWTASAAGSSAGYRCRIDTPAGAKIPANNGVAANIISNQFMAKTANQTYLGNEGVSIQNGGGNPLDVYSVSFNTSDISLWKTHLSNNPLQICYELAEPITVQLTPQDIQMLKGYNYISSDGGGDITLTYKADRLAAIEAALAALA